MKVHRSDDRWLFHCPACGCLHGPDDRWQFNGDLDHPTFKPSILVRSRRPPTEAEAARIMAGEQVHLPKIVCHSFVTDGKIYYLPDCTHEMAEQTVEIPDWESAS